MIGILTIFSFFCGEKGNVSSCCEESDLVLSINLQPILFLIWHLVDSSPSYRVGVLPGNSPLPRPPSRRRSPDLAIDVMDEKDSAIIMI